MKASGHKPVRMRVQVLRVALVVGGIAAFLGVATLINPTSSIARVVRGGGFALANRAPTSAVTDPAAGGSAEGREPAATLGSLEGPEFRVIMTAAHDHASYSVFNAVGKPVAVDVLGSEVYKSVPDLDVRSMMADVEVDSSY